MLIAARHLIDRLRHPRTRADEVRDVRRRLVAQPSAADASPEQIRLAQELARLRAELTKAVGEVRSCSGCARGRPLPQGRWAGGQCCSGHTDGVFTDDELAALRLSGTSPSRLAPPPPTDHAGCAFRGPVGCSLDVADRPNLCVRYICRELEGELASGPDHDWPRVRKLARELGDTFTRFAKLRVEPPPG